LFGFLLSGIIRLNLSEFGELVYLFYYAIITVDCTQAWRQMFNF
jgi:hypothetical protein